jgi:hypothetical protein
VALGTLSPSSVRSGGPPGLSRQLEPPRRWPHCRPSWSTTYRRCHSLPPASLLTRSRCWYASAWDRNYSSPDRSPRFCGFEPPGQLLRTRRSPRRLVSEMSPCGCRVPPGRGQALHREQDGGQGVGQDALERTWFVESRSEARRTIEGGGAYVNNVRRKRNGDGRAVAFTDIATSVDESTSMCFRYEGSRLRGQVRADATQRNRGDDAPSYKNSGPVLVFPSPGYGGNRFDFRSWLRK